VLLLAGLCLASPKNWNGTGDSCRIDGFNGTDLLYGKAFNLTDFEDISMCLKVNDTTSTGFVSDSIWCRWGYQNGRLYLDTTGSIDTSWGNRIVVDTLVTDSLGKTYVGKITVTGTITDQGMIGDTLSLLGWATQDRVITPGWSPLIRPWIQGITGNIVVTPLKVQFEVNQKLGTNMRRR